jgi:glycerol kinase
MKYFASIDQGTTSTRFIVFNQKGHVVAEHQQELKQYLPDKDSVEHDPIEIWEAIKKCIKEVDKIFSISQISSIGVTNQRETTLAWSKSSGKPLHNALVWHDTRTQDICNELKQIPELSDEFLKTGLPIATYFSLSKILWLLRNIDDVQKARSVNDLCFGTIDSWIIYKLTGNHFTDVTNASRTLMMNLETLSWIDKILNILDIPIETLPEIKPSMFNYGSNKEILKNIPITAVLGDQQASLFGQNCLSSGDVKNTYGTGCFALTNTGSEIVHSNNGLLSTVAYQKQGSEPQYALEGSVSIAGAAVQWLRDNLNIIDESSDVEALAMSVKDNGDVYFVPAFSGLFSPHWDETARGVLVGLSRFSNKSHIARAVLESVAYQSFELLESMERDTGVIFESVKVDGGMVANNLLMQFQSDIFDKKIISQEINEITALGAGAASYLFLADLPLEKMADFISNSKSWSPNFDAIQRVQYISKWNKAISKAKQWI